MEQTGQTRRQVLTALGISSASFYRWQQPKPSTPSKQALITPSANGLPAVAVTPAPTPAEEAAVREYARAHPRLGYKKLAWQMLDQNVAALRPHEVYGLLQRLDLIARRPKVEEPPLTRPEPPTRPDEVWHVDLMYVRLTGRWYYLVDIVDGYSRFLVHWSLNTTMLAETVTLTVQQALDGLDQVRQPEAHVASALPPRIIHDHGSQFTGAEWRSLIKSSGLTDIKTRVAHPESNGVVERLHRTHREEASLEEGAGYHAALTQFTDWCRYYNHERPHSALRHLCPIDYYRGDPAARLAERRTKLEVARAARAAHWKSE
jgi:transposase InsO family protein